MRTNRRQFAQLAAGGALAAITLATATGAAGAAPWPDPPYPGAPNPGMLVDYARGIPSAAAIRAAGYAGAIRYVSDRRAGAEWMTGKPLLADEATALRAAGLCVVSCYQYGKGPTADWRGGFAAGVRHARRGLELHTAAGGPVRRPIYASIDDNPTAAQFDTRIAPYLTGWRSVVGPANLGVYANAPTIERARRAGLGAWFWQHDWGTPRGFVHPAAQLHQLPGGGHDVAGVDVDRNVILRPDYGQW
jgi:hypothetical protein